MKPYIVLAITSLFVLAAAITTGCASSGTSSSTRGHHYGAPVYYGYGSSWGRHGGYYHHRPHYRPRPPQRPPSRPRPTPMPSGRR